MSLYGSLPQSFQPYPVSFPLFFLIPGLRRVHNNKKEAIQSYALSSSRCCYSKLVASADAESSRGTVELNGAEKRRILRIIPGLVVNGVRREKHLDRRCEVFIRRPTSEKIRTLHPARDAFFFT